MSEQSVRHERPVSSAAGAPAVTVSTREPSQSRPAAAYAARIKAELAGFFRQRESMVFTLLFPVALLLLFGFVFGDHVEVAPGVSFVQYFVAGMVGAGILASSFQNLAIMIPIERDSGLLKRLRGTPMPKSAYFVGKVGQVIVVATISTVVMIAVGLVAFGVSWPATPQRWLVFVGVLFLGTASCTLLGIAFSSVPKDGSSAPALVTPIALVLQFISGVFLLFTSLPEWLQTVAAIFPLKWITQGLRYAFLPDVAVAAEPAGSWELGTVFGVLGAWTVVGLVLCLLTFRWTTRTDR